MAKKAKNDKRASAGSEVYKKFKQNPGLYVGSVIILVLVIIVFLGGDLITPRTSKWDGAFGYYDKVPIRWARDNVLDQFVKDYINYYESQEGVDLSNPWDMAQIWQQAFEMAVVPYAVLQIMKRSNYVLPAKIVDRKVVQHPSFQENGQFSPILYNRLSKSDQLNLWRKTQEDIIKNVYFSDIFDGLLLNDAEAEFIGNMASCERKFNMVSFNIDNYPEAEYIAYAQANARLFDSLHLSRITISSSEREAAKILDSINSNVISFEEAARAQSQDGFANRGGDMGTKFLFEWETEIPSAEGRDSVFNLRKGEISPVLRLGETWVIYRAEDEIKKADFEDESVMETVRSYLRRNDRGKMEDWAIARAREFALSANETSFEAAAREKDLEILNFGPFPVNYSGVELFAGIQAHSIPGFSEREAGDLSRNENFWKIAFSTPVGASSEPFVQESRVLVLCPTEEINNEDAASIAASNYLSSWLYRITEQSMQYYFLNNPRMDNRFIETYIREMMP